MGEPVIIVTGTPGTGKSSIGTLLSQTLECTFIDTSALLREGGATLPDPTGRDTSIIDPSLGSRIIADTIDSVSGCIVAETLYPSLWIESAWDKIALIVLLRCHPRELCLRLKPRGWVEPKVLENCASEALGYIATELLEWSDMVVEVDTTGKSPEEALDELWRLVEEWRTGVSIDWLTLDEDLASDLTRWLTRVDSNKYGLVE